MNIELCFPPNEKKNATECFTLKWVAFCSVNVTSVKTFFSARLLVNLAEDKISHNRCFHEHSCGGWHSPDRRQMGDTAFLLPWRISSSTLTIARRSDQRDSVLPFWIFFRPLPPAGPWQQSLIPHDLIQVSTLSWSPLWLLPTPQLHTMLMFPAFTRTVAVEWLSTDLSAPTLSMSLLRSATFQRQSGKKTI